MQSALKLTTQVLPGGKIEVTDAQLPEGKSVDVIVIFPHSPDNSQQSILEVLAQSPGKHSFKSAEEVDAYIASERDEWDN